MSKRIISLGDENGIQLKDPRLAEIQESNRARLSSQLRSWASSYYKEILRIAEQHGLSDAGTVRKRFLDEDGRVDRFVVSEVPGEDVVVLSSQRRRLKLWSESFHERRVAVLEVDNKPYILEPMLRLPDVARKIGLRLPPKGVK